MKYKIGNRVRVIKDIFEEDLKRKKATIIGCYDVDYECNFDYIIKFDFNHCNQFVYSVCKSKIELIESESEPNELNKAPQKLSNKLDKSIKLSQEAKITVEELLTNQKN